MGKARDALRAAAHDGRFYDLQARIMAEILDDDPDMVKAKTERLIYRGWEPLFHGLKLYDEVRETLTAFREAGLKLGLLSDFPPDKKIEYLGLTEMWDATLCSEWTGRLKPDPRPFLALADALGEDPKHILYVGNSERYDVIGSLGAGYSAALIGRRKNSQANFVFSRYRQLRGFVLT